MKDIKNKNYLESLKHALNGIRSTAKTERNFRIQIFFGILAVMSCIIFRVELWLFVLVAFAICLVLATELINTAIEALTDLYSNGKLHPLAKKAKDAAAAAVLFAALFAVVVGIAVAISIVGRFL